MPEHLRYCLNELLLHDADVWSVARESERLIMVMRRDFPPRDVVILTYTLAGEPVINTAALPGRDRSNGMSYMYDEWDLAHEDGRKVYLQSILFSNGWEMQLASTTCRWCGPSRSIPCRGPCSSPFLHRSAPQPA